MLARNEKDMRGIMTGYRPVQEIGPGNDVRREHPDDGSALQLVPDDVDSRREFDTVERFEIFSPRLNIAYYRDLAHIMPKVLRDVERDVIRYV